MATFKKLFGSKSKDPKVFPDPNGANKDNGFEGPPNSSKSSLIKKENNG